MKKFSKTTAALSLALCFILVFSSVSFAATVSPNAATVESIRIKQQCGIIIGEAIQLEATTSPDDAWLNGVKWSSSNPDVISCSSSGYILGKKEGCADITCKAILGEASATMRIYCVKPITRAKVHPFALLCQIYAQPAEGAVAHYYLNLYRYLKVFVLILQGLSPILKTSQATFHWSFDPLTALGKYGDYVYLRFGANLEKDGFIKYTSIEGKLDGFLYLSKKHFDVWADNIAYEENVLTANGAEFSLSDNDKEIIGFNENTGQITGKKPGFATITVALNGTSQTCTVRSLYKWRQEWTGKALTDTYVYVAQGRDFSSFYNLAKGEEFTVYGDTGSSDGWAYGVSENGSQGYVRISDISTKGTVSQYNNMTTTIIENGKEKEVPWFWPVRDVKNGITQSAKARYIYSPYGWRDTDPARHKGVDITNGVSSNSDFDNSVDGYEVVSAFAGKVIYVCEDKYKSCGYCVAIRSTEKDSITGKHFVAIYMHLKYIPDVELNENVSANKKLGYVGDTGNSGGSHLHFEVNNQNLSYGQKIYYENNSDKEMVFGSVINPLFFYMNYYNLPEDDPYKIIVNPDCAAMNYRKPLWYGDDIKESKKP